MAGELKLTAMAWIRLILTERARRRRWMAGVLFAILFVFALGNWPLADWLAGSAWLFLFWWGGCAFLCFFLIVFALYDVLRVIREERDRVSGKD